MAIDRTYGKLSIPGVPDDEPVFVLRGQDVLAERTIIDYALNALRVGASREFVVKVIEAARDVANWSGLKKVPD